MSTPTPGDDLVPVQHEAQVVLSLLAGSPQPLTLEPAPFKPRAHYDPYTGDTTLHFTDAQWIPAGTVTTVAGRRRDPVPYGVIAHQVAHHNHTRWEHVPAQPGVLHVAGVLEELRAEYEHLADRPQDTRALRAAALATTPALVSTRPGDVAVFAALTIGRVDNGVHHQPGLTPIIEVIYPLLPADTWHRLRDLWREALAAPDRNLLRMVQIANRWVHVVGSPTPRTLTCMDPVRGLTAPGSGNTPAPGAAGGGEPAVSNPAERVPDHARDAINDWLNQDPATTMNTGTSEQEDDALRAAGDRARDTAAVDKKARDKAKKRAEKALRSFPTNDANDPTVDSDTDNDDEDPDHDEDGPLVPPSEQQLKTRDDKPSRASRITTIRPPTDSERALARSIGRTFKKAQFREPVVQRFNTAIPPGRLLGRELVLAEAQHHMGMMPTAKPFRYTRRRPGPEPPLRIGVMMDTSGSMSWARMMISSLIWCLTNATRYCDADVAAVTFGGAPHLIARPGRPPRNVHIITTGGGNERFAEGFEVVDGVLDLTVEAGARILIVVSDGQYSPRERTAAKNLVARARSKGCLVLWVTSEYGFSDIPAGAAPVVVAHGYGHGGGDGSVDVSGFPALVADAVAEQLRHA